MPHDHVTPGRWPSHWPGARLHVVTGKGGTGKTTVAAAAALALATEGRRTLLVEVEGRQGIAAVFGCPPLPYAERRVAVVRGGGEVHALAVDVEDALLEYLETVYHLGPARWALGRLGALDFVTMIAPGLRDVFLTGKICQTLDAHRGGTAYDAVVVDAPPAGRVARFLNVNQQVAGLARVGPVRHQAESIMEVLRSAQTVVHVVTLLEELPAQETVDLVAELRDLDLPVGGVLINMVRGPILLDEDLALAHSRTLPGAELAAGLTAAGLRTGAAVVDALVGEAVDTADRVALEAAERAGLASLVQPRFELPWRVEGIDLDGLHELAAALTHQGFG